MAKDAPDSVILKFPRQRVHPDEIDTLDEKSLIAQARLHITELFAGIEQGRIPLDDETINDIKNVDQFLQKFGDSPLDLTFLTNR